MSGEQASEPKVVDLVRNATLEASSALFSSSGHKVRREENASFLPAHVTYQLVSLIGFTGPSLRGMVGIGSTTTLFEQTHPSAISKPGHALGKNDVCDWAAELANRLLGRMANSLSAHGLYLALSTP